MSNQVILTGLRANNDLQIGNYFGALLPVVQLATKHSDNYVVNVMLADLHSFTTPIDHAVLQKQILSNIKAIIATGLPLDNTNIRIFRQSYISAHSELTWILSCFSGFGELSRMTEFKDKSARLGNERIGVGQFIYPVLQASDILLYNTMYVPVGEDQRQHVEFSRDIAGRMNSKFGDILTVPKSMDDTRKFREQDKLLRIMDLQDPTKKMSKSDETGKGVIFLNDEPQAAHKKIMSATTDSLAKIAYDPENQPGITNLIDIYALLSDQKPLDVLKKYEGQTQYGEFKKDVANAVEQFLITFQANLAAVDDLVVIEALKRSETLVREQADQTLLRVQKAVGLR